MKTAQTRFLPLLILAMLVNVLSQSIHEAGHWIVYQGLGHGPVWGFIGLVQVWETAPQNPAGWVEVTGSSGQAGWLRLRSKVEGKVESAAAAAGGPLASLSGALLGLAVAKRSTRLSLKQIGSALALTTSLVMFLYYLRSPLRTGGDEYNLGIQLGINKSIIEILFAGAFTACLALGLRPFEDWRTRLKWLGTILLGSIPTGLLLMIADNLVRAQVDAGNLFFQPMLGFSFPVLLVNGSVLVGLWIWARVQESK